MTADEALALVNTHLKAAGRPPVQMSEPERRLGFLRLQHYAHVTQRPLEVAIADLVRFQLQGEALATAPPIVDPYRSEYEGPSI